jgi:hypothetical protein
MRQRLACILIGASLVLISGLVALLLSDALAPGRVPPMLAFWCACTAGGLLIFGLVLLGRGGATDRRSPQPRPASLPNGIAQGSVG